MLSAEFLERRRHDESLSRTRDALAENVFLTIKTINELRYTTVVFII